MQLHPDFPVVDGQHQLTAEWAITLDGPFNRRIEDGDLVLWRPGLTVWIAIWNNDEGASIGERLAELKAHQSPDASAVEQHEAGAVVFHSYRLAEESDDERLPALYGYAFADCSHVQMAVYFDEEEALPAARALHRGLVYTAAGKASG